MKKLRQTVNVASALARAGHYHDARTVLRLALVGLPARSEVRRHVKRALRRIERQALVAAAA